MMMMTGAGGSLLLASSSREKQDSEGREGGRKGIRETGTGPLQDPSLPTIYLSDLSTHPLPQKIQVLANCKYQIASQFRS